MEPMTFQESDCVFTAFDQRSISNNHCASLKEKELRKGVAMPSNATLLFDASTSESTTVTTSSSTSAFRNFAIISSWTRACSGEVKTEKPTVSTIIRPQVQKIRQRGSDPFKHQYAQAVLLGVMLVWL